MSTTTTPSVWTEHRNPEGRTYWFNPSTNESVWEKPDGTSDLKNRTVSVNLATQRALNETKWKEYFSGGRKYYYNTETKESKWDMPDELLLLLEKVEKDSAPVAPKSSAPPGFTPVGSGALVAIGSEAPAAQTNGAADNLAVGLHTGGAPFAPTPALPSRPNLPDDPVVPHNGFNNFEEGEKAFIHLLRKAGVDPTWTWEQTMRAIITDPLYRALNSLAEKKATFQKYTTELQAKEQLEKEARLAKLRPALRNMLKGNPNVFHYTTFATADKLFAQHPIWQQSSNNGRSKKRLNVDVVTRWRDAQERLLKSSAWRDDAELQKLPTLDILLAFEDYSRVREREYEEQMRRTQVEKTRKERKTREAFKSVLEELVASGQIKARTKWKDVYPLFKSDERYLNMLGNPGSNPLELFWDAVDALDQALEKKIAIAEEAIERYNRGAAAKQAEGEDVKMEDADKPAGQSNAFAVDPETKEEDFVAAVKAGSQDDPGISSDDIHAVFVALQEAATKKRADEKRRAERRLRHLQDDLRYALKRLSIPSETVEYEAAVPLMQDLPEFKAIEDEEARKAAWSKYVKRQKERQREAAEDDDAMSAGSRRRKEPNRDGDRDRGKDYDRGGRGHHRRDEYSSRDHGRDHDRERRRDHRRRESGAKDWDDRRDSRRRSRSPAAKRARHDGPDRDAMQVDEKPSTHQQNLLPSIMQALPWPVTPEFQDELRLATQRHLDQPATAPCSPTQPWTPAVPRTSSGLTMKTRVAVRDTPHRFQVVPLREAPKNRETAWPRVVAVARPSGVGLGLNVQPAQISLPPSVDRGRERTPKRNDGAKFDTPKHKGILRGLQGQSPTRARASPDRKENRLPNHPDQQKSPTKRVHRLREYSTLQDSEDTVVIHPISFDEDKTVTLHTIPDAPAPPAALKVHRPKHAKSPSLGTIPGFEKPRLVRCRRRTNTLSMAHENTKRYGVYTHDKLDFSPVLSNTPVRPMSAFSISAYLSHSHESLPSLYSQESFVEFETLCLPPFPVLTLPRCVEVKPLRVANRVLPGLEAVSGGKMHPIIVQLLLDIQVVKNEWEECPFA
uniref:Formin binding protein n=1 Tax=Mycena chlorophos TaxID=658473 RepID=A0ABQ0MBX5_MYCCL|nr:predicted protein [Mycena chlorophos]